MSQSLFFAGLAYQIAGKPSLQTEVMWNAPNRFIADGPLLLSAYGGGKLPDDVFAQVQALLAGG